MDYETPSDTAFVNCWLEFLNSPNASRYVPNWETHFQNVLDNVVQDDNANYDDKYDYENPPQEEWMILSNYHELQGMHKTLKIHIIGN